MPRTAKQVMTILNNTGGITEENLNNLAEAHTAVAVTSGYTAENFEIAARNFSELSDTIFGKWEDEKAQNVE